jgi:hypothetical protein
MLLGSLKLTGDGEEVLGTRRAGAVESGASYLAD